MKRKKPVEWIAVLTETGLAGWSRASGTVKTLPRAPGLAPDAAFAAVLPLLDAPRGSAGLVLAADFFAQSIRLPARQTQGLSEDELHRVLAFEAEPFSQIAPDAGLLACAPAAPDPDGSRAWEVVQIARADAEALQRAVRDARLRLAALGAPPRGFDAAAPDVAAATLRALADGTAPAPLAPPAAKPSPFAISGAGLRQTSLAIALVGCLATYFVQESRLKTVRAELSRREVSAQRLSSLQGELQSLRAQADEIVRARREAADASARLVAFHNAWGALLRSLSSAGGGGTVIHSLAATGPFAATVGAFSADEAEPARAMAAIAADAAHAGWSIHPGRIEAGGNGGLVRFAFTAELDPAAADAAAPADAPESHTDSTDAAAPSVAHMAEEGGEP